MLVRTLARRVAQSSLRLAPRSFFTSSSSSSTSSLRRLNLASNPHTLRQTIPFQTLHLQPFGSKADSQDENENESENENEAESVEEEGEVEEGEEEDEPEVTVNQGSGSQSNSSDDKQGIEVVVRRKMVKGSVKKFNLLAKLVSGMYVKDALRQMAFSKKRKAIVMRELINLGAVRALQDHDIPMEHLKIEHAIVSRAQIMKRVRFHARGRVGKNYHRFSRLYLSLREVGPKPKVQLKEGEAPSSYKWTVPMNKAAKVGEKKAKRRAANAALNAAALGGQLQNTAS